MVAENELLLQAEVCQLQTEIRAALDRIEAHAVEGIRLENETRRLRGAVDRLRTQLHAARKCAEQLAGVLYNHRQGCPCTRCEVLHAYDKVMKESTQ